MTYSDRHHDPSRVNFHSLGRHQQIEAALRLLDSGMSEHSVAAACGWSIEFLRHIAGERREYVA